MPLFSPSFDGPLRGASRAVLLAALALVASCSSESAPAPAAPPGPPNLKIDGPIRGTTQCLTQDPNGTVAIVLVTDSTPGSVYAGSIKNVTLSSPYACVGIPQCGFVVAKVSRAGDDSTLITVTSAGPTISIPMGQFGPGDYVFRVELRNSDGTPMTNAAGAVYSTPPQSATITYSCPLDAGAPADGGTKLIDGGPRTDAHLTDATVTDATVTDATVTDATNRDAMSVDASHGDAHAPTGDAATSLSDAGAPLHADAAVTDAARHD